MELQVTEVSNFKNTQWNTDLLIIRDKSLFTYGWCADAVERIEKLELQLDYVGGAIQFIKAQYGTARPDVKAAFTDLCIECGYVAYAALTEAKPVSKVSLIAVNEHGDRTLLGTTKISQNDVAIPWVMLQAVKVKKVFARGFLAIKKGEWRKIGNGILNLGNIFVPRINGHSELEKAISDLGNGVVLMLDHNLGGGANIYRRKKISEFQRSGRSVLIWTFVLDHLRYKLEIHKRHCPDELPESLYLEWEQWSALLHAGIITSVIYNNSVSFSAPQRVPEMLCAFKKVGHAKLIVNIHDFNTVCPSHFLLNDEKKFCGVPDIEQCKKCLPKIDDQMVRLYDSLNIEKWRSEWNNVFSVADEIVFFSESSRKLLSRAYPNLRTEICFVRPHQVPNFAKKYIAPTLEVDKKIVVAIVGSIGFHKGSEIVAELQAEIRATKSPVQIVVIGRMLTNSSVDGVVQTGEYEPEDLPALLTKNEVNLALMPSIVPETFSYVTHELMLIGIPIMTFQLGAQAEAISRYARGKVIENLGSRQLLDQILAFMDEISGNSKNV